jgi:hypothetical protein
VTAQLEVTEPGPGPLDAPRPRRSSQRVALAAGSLAVIIAAVVIVANHQAGSPSAEPPVPGATQSSAPPRSAATPSRLTAVRSLLRERAAAMVHHDRARFMATIDPVATKFRRSEATMFANTARVRFTSWSYTLGSGSLRLPTSRARHYDAPAWAPSGFALHYRLAGFDGQPTDLPQYPTFVDRSGRWYLASLSGFRRRGDVSSTGLWDYAPVDVVRRGPALVLGPGSELATMTAVAQVVETAIPEVTAVWGRHWARRAVVLVPSTQHEMSLVTADRGDLDQIAALTSSEVGNVRGSQAPVGDRITINPRNWPKLGPLGANVVLAHELTHVASRADTSAATPKWLSEGLAEYVGFHDTDVAATVAAAELATDVRSGRAPTKLPRDAAFRGDNPALPQAYETSWLACRSIATRYGQDALVRFYRAVGASAPPSAVAVNGALRRVLGISDATFTVQWRDYVRSELVG